MLWQERDWVDFLGERILEERKDIVMGYKIQEIYELQIDWVTSWFNDDVKKEIEKVYERLTNCKSVTDRETILKLEEFVEVLVKINRLYYIVWDCTCDEAIDTEAINKIIDDLIKSFLYKFGL